jgi:hypothetical protein
MSQYAVLLCPDKKKKFMLGTAILDVRPDKTLHVQVFYNPNEDKLLNSEQLTLNKALWKFLAETYNHALIVKLEYQLTNEEHEYSVIGQEIPPDISYEEFIGEWKG